MIMQKSITPPPKDNPDALSKTPLRPLFTLDELEAIEMRAISRVFAELAAKKTPDKT